MKYWKKYYLNNKEKVKRRTKKWKKNNPKKVLKIARRWRAANIDKVRAYSLKSYYKNIDKNRKRFREKSRKYRIENADIINARVRKHYKENPEIYANRKRKFKYGVPFGWFEAKLKSQKNKCAICGRKMQKPFVDHNHRTNTVRDLLCQCCNAALGQVYEDIRILKKMVVYLNRHKRSEKHRGSLHRPQ